MTDSVCVKTCNTAMEGNIIKGFLQSHGIKSKVSSRREPGLRRTSHLSQNISVLVSAKDAGRARELLSDQ